MDKKKINTSLPGYFNGFAYTLIHLTVGATSWISEGWDGWGSGTETLISFCDPNTQYLLCPSHLWKLWEMQGPEGYTKDQNCGKGWEALCALRKRQSPRGRHLAERNHLLRVVYKEEEERVIGQKDDEYRSPGLTPSDAKDTPGVWEPDALPSIPNCGFLMTHAEWWSASLRHWTRSSNPTIQLFTWALIKISGQNQLIGGNSPAMGK